MNKNKLCKMSVKILKQYLKSVDTTDDSTTRRYLLQLAEISVRQALTIMKTADRELSIDNN